MTWAYDAAGRRTTVAIPNGVTTEYGWDDANQLTGLTHKRAGSTIGGVNYTYDLAGRRTSMSGPSARVALPPAMSAASYDAANQLTMWAGTAYGYDANGNLTSDGIRSYTWDARDRLTGLSGGGITATFGYDAFDRRRSRTVSATTAKFLYDGANVVHTMNPSNVVNTTLLNGGGLDERYSRTTVPGGVTSAYLTDALGSTLALVSSSGSTTASFTYEPYGVATKTGSDDTTFRYTGREDDGTGLLYYRARYVFPRTGRFISQDPLGIAAGENLYSYVEGSPTNAVDPEGLRGRAGGNSAQRRTAARAGQRADSLVARLSPTDHAAWLREEVAATLVPNPFSDFVCVKAECIVRPDCRAPYKTIVTEWIPDRPRADDVGPDCSCKTVVLPASYDSTGAPPNPFR